LPHLASRVSYIFVWFDDSFYKNHEAKPPKIEAFSNHASLMSPL